MRYDETQEFQEMKSEHQRLLTTAFRLAMALALLVVVIASASDALACPTCKDGLAENDAVSQANARGYFYSILFMMAMPFVIITTFGSAAYISIRRARGQNQSQNQRQQRGRQQVAQQIHQRHAASPICAD